jgi:predicted DNA-binding ArsR family transcriptional regulator
VQKQEVPFKPNTIRGEVYSALKKNRKWMTTTEIEDTTGDFGLRRLRELRADGLSIEKKRNPDGSYSYRLPR